MSLVEAASEADYAFKNIPIIDISNITSPDPAARRALADQVRNACINVGFFYVKNHTVPTSTIDTLLSHSKTFFDLPLESKMKIENKKSLSYKGYSPLLSGNNDPNSKGDLQEGFEIGWEPLTSSTSDKENQQTREDVEETGIKSMAGGNVWPSDPGMNEFKTATLEYYHAAVNLGKLLFPIFALALNIEETFFEDKTKTSAAMMRIIHYPEQSGRIKESEENGVIGIGAHTDWECFTILYQQPGIQALQVRNADGEWIDAPPVDGTFVVNLGDQFARWTNDIFKSTIHRVINKSGHQRFSIPLFFGTDYGVLLEPIPSCVSPHQPWKYSPVTAGEYVKKRLEDTYGH
ncbi:2OG-Fe(II) oxygenase [Marasmius fiardii PR-910]|nr:2OG-Fe(II) oxygenase [Marasmius fiardii PR-910]